MVVLRHYAKQMGIETQPKKEEKKGERKEMERIMRMSRPPTKKAWKQIYGTGNRR